MTKEKLVDLVSLHDAHKLQEEYYLEHGPDKHEQEEHYELGVQVVKMNVDLLREWLAELKESGVAEAFEALPKADRREVWVRSGFHFGIMGYEEKDAEFY